MLAVILVLALVSMLGWYAISVPRGSGLLAALTALLPDLPADEQRIGQILVDNYREYRANARNWSGAYFGCLFLSAACAATAGLVLKLEYVLRNEGMKKDLAAVLAMVSALLVTLSTTGSFQEKWAANRLAASRMEQLGYAFLTADRKAKLADFSARIQVISYARNEQIASGANPGGTPNGASSDSPTTP